LARAGFRALARFAFRAGFFFLTTRRFAFGRGAFLFFFGAAFRFAAAFRGLGRGIADPIMGSSIIGAGSGAIGGSGGNIGSIMPGPPIPVRSLVAIIYVLRWLWPLGAYSLPG
jgi:hypothetical protein